MSDRNRAHRTAWGNFAGVLVGVLAAFALIAAGCGDSDDDTTDAGSAHTGGGASTTTGPGGTSTSAPTGAATLEGPTWSLTGAGGFTVPDAVTITATFDAGTVAGSGGCNRYTAPYEVDGDALTIEPAAATQMACAAPIAAAEQAYFAALGAVDGFSIGEDGTLELSTTVSGPLVYAQQVQSVAGSWNVIGYLVPAREAFVSVIVDTVVTADFDDAGNVSGMSGCNSYSGGYQTEGTTISIGSLASTRMACAEPEGVMDQETAFLAAMQSATSFALEGADLILFDAEGRRAVQLQTAS
jgi:heat shock protein HslJ